MVVVMASEIAVPIAASWILNGQVHLPAKDVNFPVNMLDRVVCIALSLISIVLLTYLINKFLVNAKKDEMTRNTEQVKNVLRAVETLSESLQTAGLALSQVSENESASAQELAATSEQLMKSSNILSSKTDESMSNNGEVSDSMRATIAITGKLAEAVQINQDIAESIRNENEQFYSINAMAESNAHDTSEAATQADTINDIVNEMTKLFKQNED